MSDDVNDSWEKMLKQAGFQMVEVKNVERFFQLSYAEKPE